MNMTVVYAVCAVLILLLVKDMNPTYALLGGVFVSLVLVSASLGLFADFVSDLSDMLDEAVTEHLSLMLKVTGVSICADVGADICVSLGYATVAKGLVMYARVSILLLALPLVKELLDGIYALL